MKRQMLVFSGAILLAGWAGCARGDIVVFTNTPVSSTNARSSTSNAPVAWPISPRDPTAAADATMPGTNTIVLIEPGNTNTPAPSASAPTPPAATPPVPAPTGEQSPDSIQSAPTLQGSAPGKGPI